MSLKKIKLLNALAVILLVFLVACSEEKSDDERILEEVDTFSVHLMLGLKIITSNPRNDSEVTAAQNTIAKIFKDSSARNDSEGLSLLEIKQLAEVTYQAKGLGERELSLGKTSDFRFLSVLARNDGKPNDSKLAVKQDHAVTLAGLYLLTLYPVIPLPISKEILLYEAWMADDAEIDNQFINALLRTAQVSTFAQNDYCDFAWKKTELMRQRKVKKFDIEAVRKSFFSSPAMARVAAHAPEMINAFAAIALAPAIIEITPSVLRIMAHADAASCFDRKGDENKALKQYQYAIETMQGVGIAESELALFRAAVSYKEKDFKGTKKHLKNAAKSLLLDKRSQQDLITLADNIQSPDDSMISRYFSSANLTFTVGKIINQRLIDEGVYNNIESINQLKKMAALFNDLMNTDTNKVLDIGKGLLDKID